jgi:hypothetical protein
MAGARDPHEMAAAAGAAVEDAAGFVTLTVAFLDGSIGLTWPDLELAAKAPALPDHVLALVLYYLARSDGTLPVGRLTSFAELPDGRFYVQAFRGYTGAVLARGFAEKPEALERAAESLGGRPTTGLADRAWQFEALPRVPLTLLWWDGDDEFDARAEIMFDCTASHHLTTDGCAVLGSWLTSTLLARVGA